MVGAGGLGCPAALYLAASGIGKLTLADPDKVDLTNLQRQILYRTDSVGAVKVDAAQSAISALNPDVRVIALKKRIEAKDLDEAIEIAGRVPGARKGTVEVRPVFELSGLPGFAP